MPFHVELGLKSGDVVGPTRRHWVHNITMNLVQKFAIGVVYESYLSVL